MITFFWKCNLHLYWKILEKCNLSVGASGNHIPRILAQLITPEHLHEMADERYDFVIVGGGTAGLVLANRLSESSDVTVLVLEAGSDLTSNPRVTTPALFPTLLGSDADWNTVTEPQVRLPRSAFDAHLIPSL